MNYCKFCSYNRETGFDQESELIKHIKSEHLHKFTNKKGIIYRCCYGQNNKCEVMSNGKFSDFNSEKEYEKHLISNHLKKILDQRNHFDITDTEIIANSLNYDEVKNTLNSSKKWSYHHSKINLPAVLNDPQHRQLDIFSKTWGDTFEKSDFGPCQHLVPPDKSLFIPYINKVRSSLKYRENMLKKIHNQKSFYLNSDSTPPSTLKLSNPTETHSNSPDLEMVPKIFFQSDFNLNSRDIFSLVIPIFLIPSSSSSNPNNFTLLDNTLHNKFAALSGARLKNHKWISDDNAAGRMNEKLSYYLDIVEINIAKQVSKKSNSFFEAVSTQDKVRDKLTQALTQISNVRNKLSISDESLTKKHLKILLLLQRKKNMQLLMEKLKFVKAVHSAQTTIQTLLSSNDLCGALDLISETEAIIDSSLLFNSKSVINATDTPDDNSMIAHISTSNGIRVNCLKHVKPQLQELRAFLHKMVKQEYVNIVSRQLKIEEDWKEISVKLEVDYQMVPSLLAMMRLSSSSVTPTAQKLPTKSKPNTNPFETDTISSTHKINNSQTSDTNFHSFLQLYFDDAMEESKTIVRKRVLQAYYKATATSTHINGHCTVNGGNINAGVNIEDESVTSSNNSIAASANLADQMRTLDFEDWLAMMHVIIEDMIQLVWKVKIGCYTMRETVHLYKANKVSGSSSHLLSLSQNQEDQDKHYQMTFEELAVLPYNVSESLVHRIIKLVRARSKNGFLEKLPANQFVQMVQLLHLGIGERMCGSIEEWLDTMITHQQQQQQQQNQSDQSDQLTEMCCVEDLRKLLSTCVTELMTRLVTRFHNDRREKLQLIMDNDLWKEADVPTQLQELATQITNTDTGMPHSTSQPSPTDNNGTHPQNVSNNTNNKYLELDGARYTVAAAALLLFGMISDYCQFASILNTCPLHNSTSSNQTFPFMQILPHLVSLLKIFNSRSYQLVLGAGARKVAELETISARNLAITARSLDLILALFPRISSHFETLFSIKYDINSKKPLKQSDVNGGDGSQKSVLPNTNATIRTALEQLTDVQLTIKDHIDKIGGKLVSMLEERIVSRLSSWTGKPPAPSPEIRGVCQQLYRLHDAICGILPASTERELLLHVHDGFKAHLRARVRALNIATDNGPRHGIVQAELAFYLSQLTALCGLKAFQEGFSDVWV